MQKIPRRKNQTEAEATKSVIVPTIKDIINKVITTIITFLPSILPEETNLSGAFSR